MSELPWHRAIFLQMLSATRHGRSMPPQVVAALPALMQRRAQDVDRTDSEGALVADSSAPGYLRRTLDGMLLYVPFPMAAAFPDSRTLSDIIGLACSISVDCRSALCVSGSTMAMGRVTAVSDLDVCEYVFGAGSFPARIEAFADRSDLPVLAEVKCEAHKFHFPWATCRERLAVFAGAGPPGGTESRPLKLDFVAQSRTIGVLAATNMVLWLDPGRPDEGNALGSFVHQEVVLDRGEGTTGSLVGAERLGEYLAFLTRQMTELYRSHPFKALKRCLSLCYLLDLPETASVVVELLADPVSVTAARRKRLDEVAGLIDLVDPVRQAALRACLTGEAGRDLGLPDLTWMKAASEAVILDVLDQIDELTSELEADDEPR